MYGLSDKCPASVDKLSSLLELISSLDFDSNASTMLCAVEINLFFSLHPLV